MADNTVHALLIGHGIGPDGPRKGQWARPTVNAVIGDEVAHEGLQGATLLAGRGVSRQWGNEDATVALLIGASDAQVERIVERLKRSLHQQCIGVIRTTAEQVWWL
jgi:hypothetical protein